MSASRPRWTPKPKDLAPRRACRAAPADPRSTGSSLSSIQLRVRHELHHLPFADGALAGVVDQAVGPGRGRQHRRILRVIKIQSAACVPFYAQEFAAGVRLEPVEIGAR